MNYVLLVTVLHGRHNLGGGKAEREFSQRAATVLISHGDRGCGRRGKDAVDNYKRDKMMQAGLEEDRTRAGFIILWAA